MYRKSIAYRGRLRTEVDGIRLDRDRLVSTKGVPLYQHCSNVPTSDGLYCSFLLPFFKIDDFGKARGISQIRR